MFFFLLMILFYYLLDWAHYYYIILKGGVGRGGVGGRVKSSMKKPFFLFNILCSFFLEF